MLRSPRFSNISRLVGRPIQVPEVSRCGRRAPLLARTRTAQRGVGMLTWLSSVGAGTALPLSARARGCSTRSTAAAAPGLQNRRISLHKPAGLALALHAELPARWSAGKKQSSAAPHGAGIGIPAPGAGGGAVRARGPAAENAEVGAGGLKQEEQLGCAFCFSGALAENCGLPNILPPPLEPPCPAPACPVWDPGIRCVVSSRPASGPQRSPCRGRAGR